MNFTNTILTIGYNILVMWIVATLALLLYCYRSRRGEFQLNCWLQTNTNRFQVGAIVIVGLAVLMAIAPSELSAILGGFGFDASATPVALGFAIGAILVTGVNGNKPEPLIRRKFTI